MSVSAIVAVACVFVTSLRTCERSLRSRSRCLRFKGVKTRHSSRKFIRRFSQIFLPAFFRLRGKSFFATRLSVINLYFV